MMVQHGNVSEENKNETERSEEEPSKKKANPWGHGV
jgi:hypothetical protein